MKVIARNVAAVLLLVICCASPPVLPMACWKQMGPAAGREGVTGGWQRGGGQGGRSKGKFNYTCYASPKTKATIQFHLQTAGHRRDGAAQWVNVNADLGAGGVR